MSERRRPRRARYARDDEPAARLDRNYSELLQEVRVAEVGVQVLFAFLLGIAFQPRFAEVDDFQRTVYIVTLLLSAVAIAVLIAPVAFHRLTFRRRLKDELVIIASRLALVGITVLLLAVLGSVLLVCDWVVNRGVAITITAIMAVGVGALWFGLPLRYRFSADVAEDPIDPPEPEAGS